MNNDWFGAFPLQDFPYDINTKNLLTFSLTYKEVLPASGQYMLKNRFCSTHGRHYHVDNKGSRSVSQNNSPFSSKCFHSCLSQSNLNRNK